MLIELFIVFQLIVIGLFFTAFYTHQELIWAITLVLSGVLMYTSYSIEYYVYVYNATIGAYSPEITTHSYPYLMGINLLFSVLSLVFFIFDIFDKYSSAFSKNKSENE